MAVNSKDAVLVLWFDNSIFGTSFRTLTMFPTRNFPTATTDRSGLSGGERIVLWLFGIWTLVGLPVILFDWELPFPGYADLVFMVLAASVATAGWIRAFGLRSAWRCFLWVAVVSAVAEGAGAVTGVLFGPYHYTENFGPRLFGIVPLAIPLAWWVIMAAGQFAGSVFAGSRGPVVVLLAAVFAVVFDLLLEPVAFGIREYWIWEQAGPYHGVPLQNFFGWGVLAVVLSAGLLIAGLPPRALPAERNRRTLLLFLPAFAIAFVFTVTAAKAGIVSAVAAGLLVMAWLAVARVWEARQWAGKVERAAAP